MPMTAETDLLPLPNLWKCEGLGVISARITPDDMRTYARACVSSATEALRVEVARLAEVHAGYAAQAFTLTNRAERLAEALRECIPIAEWAERESAEEFSDYDLQAQCVEVLGHIRAALDQETTNG